MPCRGYQAAGSDRDRRAGGQGEAGHDRPVFEKNALKAVHQGAAARTHAGGVLQ